MAVIMELVERQTDYTQIWVTAIGALVVIVPAILSYLQSRRTAAKVEVLATSVQGNNEQVTQLAKNIDGAMTEIKTVIGEKNLAEGKLAGIAAERDRPALVTDPQKVTEALNGPEVREQINRIEAIANETSASSARVEKHAGAVATDLSEAHARADAVRSDEHGAAADAASRQTPAEKAREEEKQLD